MDPATPKQLTPIGSPSAKQKIPTPAPREAPPQPPVPKAVQAKPMIPESDASENEAPLLPATSEAAVRGVCSGVILTFCGCFVFSGKLCGSFWRDSASCCKDSRRAFCGGSTAMFILSVALVMLAFCVLVGGSVWSSAYYGRHYAREAKMLKANASKINATHAAKEAWNAWKEDPVRDYFPMQPRYWLPFFMGIVAVVASALQVPGRITSVNSDMLDDPNDEEEKRYCLCQLNCFNRMAQLSIGVAYILDLSFSWGYFIMATTFIEDTEERSHLFVPVYSVMAQLFIMSFAILFMSFSKWIAYKEAMRYTRGDMPDDDAMEKMN